jgi:hypothetical protein
MKSFFPEMSTRQIVVFMIETSVLVASLVAILSVTIPML